MKARGHVVIVKGKDEEEKVRTSIFEFLFIVKREKMKKEQALSQYWLNYWHTSCTIDAILPNADTFTLGKTK